MTDQQKVMLKPGNPDAEAAVLGAILLDGAFPGAIKDTLKADDFQTICNQVIYDVMLRLAMDGEPIDNVTVCAALETNGNARKVPAGYVVELVNHPWAASNIEAYARIVKQDSIRRQLIAAAGEVVKEAYKLGGVDDIIAGMKETLAHIDGQSHNGKDTGIGHQESVTAYLDLLQRRYDERNKPKLAFPWGGLSRLMPFLDSGTLCGIVAESGAGKTAFLENCAEHWAQQGWRVLFCHYELGSSMIMDRRMQRQTGIPIRDLQLGGRLDGDQYAQVLKASERISAWSGNVRYVHCPGWPMSRVVAAIRAQQDAGGVDVAIVDYLNKVQMVDRHGMTSAQLRGQDVEEFKVCLEDMGIVGMMAAQFDKAAKSKRHRSLADARDTGELDDKANVGIVIDRPRDKNNQRANTAKVYVVKCNAGMEGMCPMLFEGKRLTFFELEGDVQDGDADYAVENE